MPIVIMAMLIVRRTVIDRCGRRRDEDDAVDLPRVPADDRTIGRTFTSQEGNEYRPSIFLTLTLSSYGSITDGAPTRPVSYNYRRAPMDALLFPKLVHRLWQNLGRCAGYKAQYFGAIEPQQRLAPRLRVAHTGDVLPTWEEAVEAMAGDPDAKPAHVMRLGSQADIRGIIATSEEADRGIRYLTKYLTKAIAERLMSDGDEEVPVYERRDAHIDRLHAELRWTSAWRGARWTRRLELAPEAALRDALPETERVARCGSARRPGWRLFA
jgi:hypothetical protein